ncbi:MAG TPA: SDR family oxidoreductase [Capsulimonadaceae bacterium]|nr:SDR family oxidoreductase [Capsulimonadaceae bacterium]
MSQNKDSQSVAGKAVVLTGGTTGIGRATARLLASEGAKVLIYGREEQPLHDAIEEIKPAAQNGGQIVGLTADQSKPEDVQRVFQEADRQLGGVDILVNNAAISAESILDSDYAEWEYVMKTNVLGYMNCCRQALDRMTARGNGHIVNVGSLSAKARSAGSDVYTATKSAIEGFSDSLAKQVNEQGIRVTVIEPGLVGTDMTASKTPAEKQPQKEQEQQMLTAEDLAQCVLYTLSQPARCDVSLVQIRPTKQAI